MHASPRRGPAPGVAVAAELLRALGSLALLPPRLFDYAMTSEAQRAELLADLERAPSSAPSSHAGRDVAWRPTKPVHLFLSCAEASGELHALHFAAAFRAELARRGAPPPRISGLGGARLEAANVSLVGRPVDRAAMGFGAVLSALPFYLELLKGAARHLRDERPDLCVFVDSPALHVPLGRIARRYGIPVVHFVAPQHWGWAPWRARGYRTAVDRALTILPFEPSWFARRGVPAVHVGHPLLDALDGVASTRPSEASAALVLLPGSRAGVVDRNLPWMLRVLARLRDRHPELEVVLPHAHPELEPRIREHLRAARAEEWVRVDLRDLHLALATARAAFSVSGTVLLDLLHHRLPTVVVYRLGSAVQPWLKRQLLTAPWFASVNLLAGREVLPELCFAGDGHLERAEELVERALFDERWRAQCLAGLDEAAARLGPPGACARAAVEALDVLRLATEADPP
jgi:lipid-A-disaccharide synthase